VAFKNVGKTILISIFKSAINPYSVDVLCTGEDEYIMRKSFANSLAATFMATNICLAVPAFADDLQTYNLDTIVVTAQRESKRDVYTPASVTTFAPVLLFYKR